MGSPEDFVKRAEAPQRGIVAEFVGFLRDNKKWWLAPILLILLLAGVLVVLAGGPAAPFLYPLF